MVTKVRAAQERGHKFHSTFFCATREGNDPHLRVTKATMDDGSCAETRE
jgi:hypothetical protein